MNDFQTFLFSATIMDKIFETNFLNSKQNGGLRQNFNTFLVILYKYDESFIQGGSVDTNL